MTNHHLQKRLAVLFCTFVLVGCASTGQSGSGAQQDTERAMAACLAATGQSKFLILSVPAVNNAISNQLVIASLKLGGGSNSVKALVNLLLMPEETTFLVVGDDPAITTATAEAALRELPADAKRAVHQLCIAADRNSAASLSSASDAAGIKLILVP